MAKGAEERITLADLLRGIAAVLMTMADDDRIIAILDDDPEMLEPLATAMENLEAETGFTT